MTQEAVQAMGLVAAIILPFWNIPLIMRIIKRKSSRDLSLWWVLGVWTCLLFMAPSGFISADLVWRTFNVANLVLFSFVVIATFVYRNGK